MGRARADAPPAEARPEETTPAEEALVVAAVTLLLMGEAKPPAGATLAATLAGLLLSLVPAAPAAVGEVAARLVLRDLPAPPRGAGAILAAQRGEFAYRAAYGVAAVRRIAGAVAGGTSLRAALVAETRYLQQHRDASRQRRAGLAMLEAAAERYGPVLHWNHRPRAGEERRPTHRAAEGHNFDARRVPALTGALPGVEPNCHCYVGPPVAGAPMLN